jgi:oligoendopeptidase F
MLKERVDVPLEDRWNVEQLYPSLEAWEADLQQWQGEASPRLSELLSFKGTLSKSADHLEFFLKSLFTIDRHLSKLHTYAHLRHDEDVGNDRHKEAYVRITQLIADFRQKMAWVEPEILSLPEERVSEFLNDDRLKEYRIYLQKILRLKKYTLSAEGEALLAAASLPLEAASRAFSAFNNGDLKFPSIIDGSGEERALTHGKYLLYLRERDRTLREATFKTVHTSFLAYENMLTELIQAQMQRHLFEKKARGYHSCLEAALFPNQIDLSVYTSLVKTVRQHLPSLHRYISLRRDLLGYQELHPWDLFVPLVDQVERSVTYSAAVDKVIASVALLGEEYQRDLERGLKEERWVDRYENRRKRSGAYSSGCYDSMPYILMNYQGTLNDVMTLSHEAGHSMHTLLSARHQPYHYSHYPIFVAEVASTFHEELLHRDLLKQAKSVEEQCYLIHQRIDDIRGTLFRQTLFAEFELRLHEWVEKGVPLTPSLLKEAYRQLNADYYGEALVLDPELSIEWARIPHFYYDFYVYQYATGISAANALIERVTREGEEARRDYLRFLSSGSSRYPLDLLALAGVDMRQVNPIEETIRRFDALVDQLAELMQKTLP